VFPYKHSLPQKKGNVKFDSKLFQLDHKTKTSDTVFDFSAERTASTRTHAHLELTKIKESLILSKDFLPTRAWLNDQTINLLLDPIIPPTRAGAQ